MLKLTSNRIKRFSVASLTLVSVGVASVSMVGCTSDKLDQKQQTSSIQTLESRHASGIATAHPLATAAGMQVLNEGGNAYDAAVTVAAVLAVVEPFGSGLGGGSFWLLHDNAQDTSMFVDAREKAPLAATETMYQDDKGGVDRDLATNHPLASGIPGTPAALIHVQQKYGTKGLQRLLQPAIDLANNGFKVTSEYTDALKMRLDAVQRWPSSSVFLDHGQLPKPGWTLKQPKLAKTLELIAEKGMEGFYAGSVADELVKTVQTNGGIWTKKDLAQYKVAERDPITFNYGQYKITSAPLPSSGGLVLGDIFGLLERQNYDQADQVDQIHLFVEAMKHAYYKRAVYMGDPDFTHDDGRWMLESDVIDEMSSHIKLDKARPSSEMPLKDSGSKGTQTTHFSIIDGQGNLASVTLSINLYFGSGFTAGDTGVLLNNEMDDFSAQPGSPNAYGLVGSEANKIEPGKRPLSSMSPTFVEGPDDLFVIGTPGGSRIISMVAWGVLAAIDGESAQDVVAKRRIHHQYQPDTVFFEPEAMSEAVQASLKSKGHTLSQTDRLYGDLQLVHWDKKHHQMTAASDPRGEGVAEIE